MTHVTKITKNHFFSSLTRNLAKYIFFAKINFLFKFFVNSNFSAMCNLLAMCNLHMTCKLPIFPYFTLKSNIHHVSNITLLRHIIKINVNSNYFELTSIVYIIGQNFIKTPFFIISHHFPQKYANFSTNHHLGNFPPISRYFPAKFPARKNLAQFPFTFSDQIKNPHKLTDSIK